MADKKHDDDVFDLDVLERNGAPKPYKARIGGKVYTFSDPNEQDWQQNEALMGQGTEANLRAVLGDEQYEEFAKNKLPVWKLNELNTRVNLHYAKYVGSLGEGSASSGS